MESFVDGFIGILLIISFIIIFVLDLYGSTKPVWKRVLLGGIVAAVFAVIVLILSGVPFDATFIGGVLCVGSLGASFIFGRWVSNKSTDRLVKKYGVKKGDR